MMTVTGVAETRWYIIITIIIPGDSNVIQKEAEKILKYSIKTLQ
jgi:hypothetical protein